MAPLTGGSTTELSAIDACGISPRPMVGVIWILRADCVGCSTHTCASIRTKASELGLLWRTVRAQVGHRAMFEKCHKRSSRISKIGVLQEQISELLVRAHQLPDVVLDFETRMNNGPIMRSSDKCEKRE